MKLNAAVSIILILVLSVPGCTIRKESTIDDMKGVVTEGSLVLDSQLRTYRMYVPSSYDHTPTPLLIVLHFGGGNSAIIERVTQMTEKAEKDTYAKTASS